MFKSYFFLEELGDSVEIKEVAVKTESNEEVVVEPKETVVEEKPVEVDPILDILGNGSLVKKLLKSGESDKRPKNGQICKISYQLRLKSNMDEIIEDNPSHELILGDGDVVPALDIAISLMDLNEECELKSEARHAYGEKGELPKIPPNATLIYNLKLLKFEFPPEMKCLETIERLSLAYEYHNFMMRSFKSFFFYCSDSKKQRGNYYYNRQNYELAVASYRK